jgi:hypothetical protein
MTNALLPKNSRDYRGYLFVRILTFVFMMVVVARSAIHLFSPDGGAQSIAGIDTSVAGGNNIIALFHQWGAIQLLLALLLVVLFTRYRGLTSLVLVALAADPVLREVAGQMMHVTAVGTPPGAALNTPAFLVTLALLIASLMTTGPKAKRRRA